MIGEEQLTALREAARGVDERRSGELVSVALENVERFRPLVEAAIREGRLRPLSAGAPRVFPDGSSAAVDPRERLYFYGYPDRLLTAELGPSGLFAHVDLFKRMMQRLGLSNVILTPVLETTADGVNRSKTSAPLIVSSDGGYDPASQTEVSPRVGGTARYHAFLTALRDTGLVVHDLIVTHADPRSPEFPLDLFVRRATMPASTRRTAPDGTPYVHYADRDTGAVWEVELDPANPREHHYEPYTDAHGVTWYLFHHFKPNQGALDNFDPRVWDRHLQSVGHWILAGATAGRVDAAAYLAVKDETPGKHLPESPAMLRFLRCFTDLIRPGFGLVAEVVAGSAINAAYSQDMDIVYELHGSTTLLQGLMWGDFEPCCRWFEELPRARYPEAATLVFLPSTHDHLGFHSAAQMEAHRGQYLARGADAGYSNNNAAATTADLLRRDPSEPVGLDTWRMFLGAFLGLGPTALYYADIFGRSSSVAEAWRRAELNLNTRRYWFEQEERAHAERARVFAAQRANLSATEVDAQTRLLAALAGNLDAERRRLVAIEGAWAEASRARPPSADSPLREVFDPRWMKRPRIPVCEVQAALRGANPYFDLLSELAIARRRSRALTCGRERTWLDTHRRDVGSWVRRYRDPRTGAVDEEVAVIVNPARNVERLRAGEPQSSPWVTLQRPEQLTAARRPLDRLRLRSLDEERTLVRGEDYEVQADGRLTLRVEPDHFLWLRIDELQRGGSSSMEQSRG